MSLQPTRTLGASLVAGLGTVTVTAALWTWFDFTTRVAGNEPFLAYVAVGTFVLGAVPAVLLTTKRLLTPTVVVAGAFGLSAYGTWSTYVAPARPPAPVDPTPFGWVLLGWPGIALAALLVGGVEYGLRQYRKPSSEPNATTGE